MTVVKTTLFVLMLAAGAAAAGEATAPAASTEATAKPVATEGAAKEAAAKPARPKACEYISGSRMRPNLAEGCRTASGPLRVFSQEDLQRTGEIDMNQALRKLDPIFH
jgi:hypothetical protein